VEDAIIVTPNVLELRALPEQVTPASELETLHERFRVPEKLLIGVTVSVEVALPPGAIVTLLGDALSEKSPGAVVKLNTVDHVPFSPPPEGAVACTSQ